MVKLITLRDIFDKVIPANLERIAYQIKTRKGLRDISNREFLSDIRGLAAYVYSKDVKCCAVIGENSYKQQVCYYAPSYAGAIIVPIDKELTAREMANIINASKCDMILCGDTHEDMLPDILAETGDIKTHVFLSDNENETIAGNVEQLIIEGAEIISKNAAIFDYINVDPNSVYTYVFTSGTTGVSKGVMLSHQNIIRNVESCIGLNVVSSRLMAILPMHHTLQSTLGCTIPLVIGATICINNSIKMFAQNLKVFKPYDLICVPLVIETMHQNVFATVREAGKEKAFRAMMKVSRLLRRVGIDMRKVFFKKVHVAFGGNLKTFFCGGALLDPKVARDINDWGFNMYIGYGITECSPLITQNTSRIDSRFGSCGVPLDCNIIKLVDKDENGDGEIWVKGANVMLGYLDNPEATAEVLEHGWFKTGDIGRYDKHGFLYITGRKKNLIVLSNGKNIYPEELEGFFAKYNEIKEIIVSGDKNDVGQEVTISAEIFPNYDYAKEQKIEDVESVINSIVDKVNEDLAYYKRISSVVYRQEEFAKTTTKKIKRHKL